MSESFEAGKVLFSQQSALNQLIGKFDQGSAAVSGWLADPANRNEVSNLAGALNAWAAQVTAWPSPEGVPPLDQPQKNALFAAECGVGLMDTFIALTPDMDDGTRNVYKQFYGPSSAGWGEVQDWYAHRG